MAKEIALRECEERKDLSSVSAFLHQPAERFAHNQVILRRGVEELALDNPNIILLELKVEEENAKPLLSVTHSVRN